MSQSRKMKFGRYDYAAFSCFTGYACCSVVVPVVLIELARSLNFPLTDGGMGAGGALQLGRSIPMVFAMLFCGFAAGRWGKVPTLGVSLLIMAAGIMLASAAPAYGLLFLAVAIAGLGEGVIEGLATPVVQDLHEHEEPGRYINFAHSFWSIGVVVTVLAAGALLSCAGVPGCGLFAWLMGVAGDHFGLRASFFLVPGCFVLLGALIAAEWLLPRRNRR